LERGANKIIGAVGPAEGTFECLSGIKTIYECHHRWIGAINQSNAAYQRRLAIPVACSTVANDKTQNKQPHETQTHATSL